jgi:hypothetical protein
MMLAKEVYLLGVGHFCVDGCHIKTKYKGVLLTAVGIDPNDYIFPVAFGLAEVECTSAWEWFLTSLKEDLGITNTAPWTIMSDRQKVWYLCSSASLSILALLILTYFLNYLHGLINAMGKIWPDAEHRFCVRHLIQNF